MKYSNTTFLPNFIHQWALYGVAAIFLSVVACQSDSYTTAPDADSEIAERQLQVEKQATSYQPAPDPCGRYADIAESYCLLEDDDDGTLFRSSKSRPGDESSTLRGPSGPSHIDRFINEIGWPNYQPYRGYIQTAIERGGSISRPCVDPLFVYTNIWDVVSTASGAFVLQSEVTESYLSAVHGYDSYQISLFRLGTTSNGLAALGTIISNDQCFHFSALEGIHASLFNDPAAFYGEDQSFCPNNSIRLTPNGDHLCNSDFICNPDLFNSGRVTTGISCLQYIANIDGVVLTLRNTAIFFEQGNDGNCPGCSNKVANAINSAYDQLINQTPLGGYSSVDVAVERFNLNILKNYRSQFDDCAPDQSASTYSSIIISGNPGQFANTRGTDFRNLQTEGFACG